MTTANSLDRRITIERYTETRGPLNAPIKAWGELVTVWAGRKDVSDGERAAAGTVGSFLMSRFVIRSSPESREIKTTDRINCEGIWNIKGIKETQDGRNRFLEITAAKDADK